MTTITIEQFWHHDKIVRSEMMVAANHHAPFLINNSSTPFVPMLDAAAKAMEDNLCR